ncbi:MAG: hypothetical protein ACOYNN_18380 [Terrimicrobiaceae bacterium]
MIDEAFGPDYPRKRRYSTDPQDDVPCRECETEGPEHALNDEGICRVCAAEAEDDGDEVSDALRQIAAAIGAPADVDPLADLPGLVLAVQAMVQRAESSAIVAADAVAAERMAIGAWVRDIAGPYAGLARGIEHGDHIDDDAPPLPSLRLTLAARRMLAEQVAALQAELDKRNADEVAP